MSKHHRTLQRICSQPTPSDIRWQDLKVALEFLGYKMLSGNGSRRKFFHAETNDLIICHEPHPSSIVDRGTVRDVKEHLAARGFIGD